MQSDTPRAFGGPNPPPLIGTEPAGACAVCDGAAFSPRASGFDFELQTCRNRWEFLQCDSCGHVQLDPRPAAEELGTIYPPTYYSYNMTEKLSPIAIAGKNFLDRRKFRAFLKFLPRPARTYLDIGCGDFKYLDLMAAEGIAADQLYGLELDETVVARARAKGYQVFRERAEEASSIPAAHIDVATMFHVIEHVADPGAVLASVRRWLSPGGILVLETPNISALDARLFRRRFWGGYHIPRHWHLFSREGIGRVLAQHGFRLKAIQYQTGHSFWLYSFHNAIAFNNLCPSARIARLFDPLTSLPMLILATLFDKICAFLGLQTSAMLVIAERADLHADQRNDTA